MNIISSTVIGTLAVDGWAVTFGTARRGLAVPNVQHRWQLAGRVYTVEQLAGTADAGLFKTIASNPNHSSYQIPPPLRPTQYSLRKCEHTCQLRAPHNKYHPFYRATRMHSADYAVARCLSVSVSVCLSLRHTPILSLNGYRYPQNFFTIG